MTSLEERQAARRRQMLDAGIEMLGAPEPGVLGVRAVCRSTGITERYFYEAFGTREGFVHAVYRDVSERAQRVIGDALARAGAAGEPLHRAAVDAYFDFVVEQPSIGRALLLGPDREPALAARGPQEATAFIEMMVAARSDEIDENLARMAAVALVGAQAVTYIAYLSGGIDVPRAAVVDYCVHLIEASTDYLAHRARSGS
ncbi:TetR/AcrR family transcriptional regulator [Tsukamurella paurometabola]|uniref:TetR/AcrR family transcriptional regulator n=1 Tax=Tsukamurella paurometabola TaxID=2061 RepID=A0ABS5NGI0_TSUPA|nr:TetR/AcrR family transcriptional regulator [Tsukamurella paurometabola]MBS4103374.1 TetR/AcrR family transcriptional regulator [Tsukamurella paurometabola]